MIHGQSIFSLNYSFLLGWFQTFWLHIKVSAKLNNYLSNSINIAFRLTVLLKIESVIIQIKCMYLNYSNSKKLIGII